jgi:cytochrome c oxidase cbb3-type subunit 1
VVFYISSMWIAGVMQGLMWRATNPDGTLTYSFVESLSATYPYYLGRACGGLLCLSGMLVMGWNVYKTWQAAPEIRPVPVMKPDAASALA